MGFKNKNITKKDLYIGELKISDMETHQRLDKFSFKNINEFDKRIKSFFRKFE